MSLFSAVAWDIDGTLIDSEPLHQRALVAASAALGVDLSDVEPEAFLGVHAIDIWKALRPRFPARSSFKTWIAAIEGYYVAHAGELEPNPGALEAMRKLAERGIAQACVSNSGRTIVDANIEALGIGTIIAFSLSLDDVSSGKPDPEPYLKAAAKLGFAASDCIVVEDAAAGVRAGKAAGARVIALLTTMSRRDLEDAGADWILHNCAEITAARDQNHGLQLKLGL